MFIRDHFERRKMAKAAKVLRDYVSTFNENAETYNPTQPKTESQLQPKTDTEKQHIGKGKFLNFLDSVGVDIQAKDLSNTKMNINIQATNCENNAESNGQDNDSPKTMSDIVNAIQYV